MSDTQASLTLILQIVTAVGVLIVGPILAYLTSQTRASVEQSGKMSVAAANMASETAKATAGKLNAISETVDIVHQLTNSGMDAVRAELAKAREEIRVLQQLRIDDANRRA